MKKKSILPVAIAGMLIILGSINLCLAAPQFPDNYSKSDGKVTFNCRVQVPENFTGEEVYDTTVNGHIYPDAEKAVEIYSQGKEVQDSGTQPAPSAGEPEGFYQIYTDGAALFAGSDFMYNEDTAKWYSYIGVTDPGYLKRFEENPVSFMSPEDCIEKVRTVLSNAGINTEEVSFSACPINHEVLSQITDEEIAAGTMTEAQRKESWSGEDDAYFVYGVQKHGGLPVFHESMNISQSLAFDTPDSSVIQAVYSGRGIEYITYNGKMYSFSDKEERLELKDFEEIAEVVQNKFGNLLDESTYEVTRATLYERVYLNESQQLKTMPIWYFEVWQDGWKESVTLMDAVSGEEIYLE